MPIKRPDGPDWSRLQEQATAQAGYFSIEQAAAAGFSQPLLQHHVTTGRFERPLRGIYRFSWFPPSDEEDFVLAWLWSRTRGVVSHESALLAHRLSDALPGVVHLTVPSAWKVRRLVVPSAFQLHYAEVPETERSWFGAAPVTTVERTLRDCISSHVAPELIAQALAQAEERGLVDSLELHRLKLLAAGPDLPF